jgi:hypothetical protein
MKLSKAEAVLYLYDHFLENHVVIKEDTLFSIEITDLTFRRYMSEIRCYLQEFHPEMEIHYRKGEGVYLYRRISNVER